MATVTLPVLPADGFLNNISGTYPGEWFNLCSGSSSSGFNFNIAAVWFNLDTSYIQTLAPDYPGPSAITSKKLSIYVRGVYDPNQVALFRLLTDTAHEWGDNLTSAGSFNQSVNTINDFLFPFISISLGWNDLVTNYPTVNNGTSPMCMAFIPELSDVGPSSFTFDTYEKPSGFPPTLTLTYTPTTIATSKQWSLSPKTIRFGGEFKNNITRL